MRRNSIFIFTFYIAILCIPHYATAQAYSAPAGEGWREEGVASWYGAEFDGRPTASGEIFNSALFTAAHPTLPFGTFLKVTNKYNNRWVTVKVNDRGPFVASRIIDVSKAAADHLGMIAAGIVPVIIETLPGSYASPPKPAPVAPPPPPPPPYTPPAISQAPAAMPEPTQVYTPPPPPAYAPPPPPSAAAPEPVAPEYTYVPYMPITVYPPFYSQPPQPVQSPYPAITAFPPSPMTPLFESLPPPQTLPSLETAPPSSSGFKLIPAISPAPDKKYKLQVGSYKVPRNAVETFGKLKEAGLNPAYEQNGEFYRVVLAGIRGIEVQSVADKLEEAGFREAIIREDN
ncbi:MAG: septal ring lytic transglycosylase RlpA family protein [Treponema sp.]|jgi:rare lipoprotein A|nr:septal ring lytic transglycosylase RlpA family protein [Treponema sp.]